MGYRTVGYDIVQATLAKEEAMPSFEYSAKSKDAQTVQGRIIAEDREDAVEKINQMELLPIQVQEVALSKRRIVGSRFGRIRTRAVYHFSRQMVNLLKGGIPILRALEIIAHQQKNPDYRYLLESIHLGIREGRSFSECLEEYPDIFPTFYTAMVKAGEESGTLQEVMAELAQYLKNRNEITAKVQNAFVYPALMGCLGLGSVVFILTYVLPKLAVVYKQFGQALPLPTLIVIRISNFLIHGWMVLALLVLVVMGLVIRLNKSVPFRLRLSRMKLECPGIGQFLLKVDLMRFSRTLGLLVRSGVPIVRGVHLAIQTVENELIRTELEKCREDLIAGHSFGESLRQIKYMPDMVGYLIAVGEESGNMAGSLEDIAETYHQETDDALKVMTTLLEPLLIIVVGSIIGLIVIAMLLPIFNLDMMVS